MRGIPSLVSDIRKKVFAEVARMAYNGGDFTQAEDLPYVIVPGDRPMHRESVFLERAIAAERVRLAMGLPLRPVQTRVLMTDGMEEAAVAEHIKNTKGIEIKTAGAEGLRECRKLMTLARAGRYDGYLLEGMACPGGCVAGAGTLLPVELAERAVSRYQSETHRRSPMESPCRNRGDSLEES